MAKLIGTDPNQVPTNADLGTMAYLDADRPQLGQTTVTSAGTALIVERTGDASNLQFKSDGQNVGHIYGFKNGSGGDLAFYPTNSSGTITQRMKIHSDGYVTMPYQPAFSVKRNSTAGNLAANTLHTLSWATEIFDQNSNFSGTTFTAPVTGKYHLSTLMRWQQVDSAASYIDLRFVTTNRSYQWIFAPDDDLAQDADFMNASASVLADMDAGDTAYMTIYISGGASQMDIEQGSHFFGYLVA